MSSLIECQGMKIIIIIVYRPGTYPMQEFLDDLKEEIEALPSEYRKIVVGDFNFDLRLENKELYINNYCHRLNLKQKVNYTTHIKGGILDLIMDCRDSHGFTDWMPTPFSDHFIIYYNLN